MDDSNMNHEKVRNISEYFSYLLLIVGVLGILGNLFVCIVYNVKTRKSTTSSMLFQCLALCDMLAAAGLIFKYCFQYVIVSDNPLLNHQHLIAHICSERRIRLQYNISQNWIVGVISLEIPSSICLII